MCPTMLLWKAGREERIRDMELEASSGTTYFLVTNAQCQSTRCHVADDNAGY